MKRKYIFGLVAGGLLMVSGLVYLFNKGFNLEKNYTKKEMLVDGGVCIATLTSMATYCWGLTNVLTKQNKLEKSVN